MPPSSGPAAFMSYVRRDDEHENGRLTMLREHLEGEVGIQTGLPFPIFQDRNDIAWGDNWKVRIEEGIDAVTFFIPVVTPGFFQSAACRDEFEQFRERERAMARSNLILPIYYVETDEFSDEAARSVDAIAQELVKRQFFDWRPLRFEPFTSPQVGKAFAKMARQMKAALPNAPSRPARATASPRRQADQAEQVPLPAATPEPNALSPRIEPPTFVVDAMHRGDYPSLTKAIASVPAGARLLVRPGYYPEGIVMDKPLEIIGDGPLDEIVIAAKGCHALLFQSTMGRVVNLTLRQEGGGSWYGVGIAQGRLHLESCDISSRTLACIAVGNGADPVIRGNRIHDGKQVGVLIHSEGRGTFEGNNVFANTLAGFAVQDDGDPIVRNNRIYNHDGKGSGIIVYSEGRGTFEGNNVFSNTLAGFEVQGGADPIVRNNHIRKNEGAGIRVSRGGRGTYEENYLWDNARGAWDVADDAGEVVRRNNAEGPPDGWAASA